MKKYRILLDTNILIQREDPKVLSGNLIALTQLMNKLDCDILVHPLSVKDIERDKNLQRKAVSLSKIETYKKLELYPKYDKDENFKNIVGKEQKKNDFVDNSLLYAVSRNAADFLITEDKGILYKSSKINLDEHVFNIEEAIIFFKKLLPSVPGSILPCFRIEKGWNLDLNDSIFDSLKEEYDFVNWWKNTICGKSRDVYVYLNTNITTKNNIKAILILKNEEAETIDCNPPLPLDRRLKICLFKVAEHTRGLKLGERLLKIAFEQANIMELNDIYLTHYTKPNDSLVSLIEKYGFILKGQNAKGEDIFYKKIKPSENVSFENICDVMKANKKYFPSFYDGQLVSKYLVPILPKYHERLFPDFIKEEPNTVQLPLFEMPHSYSSEGFSIKKAYICNANTQKIKKGDILLFYRTEDVKSVTSLGIVEKVFYKMDDASEIAKIISTRSVYDIDEIRNICKNKNKALVILFEHNLNFNSNVSYNSLLNKKIIAGPIQSITRIKTQEIYEKLIERNIDESLIINKT